MAKDPQHFPSRSDEELHRPIKRKTARGEGACLTGHSSAYDDGCSCTYRWQAAHADASERHPPYDVVPQIPPEKLAEYRERDARIQPGHVPTLQYLSAKGKRREVADRTEKDFFPARYSFQVPVATKPGDWAVGGPHRDDMTGAGGMPIPRGANYTRDLWPYWNNAHHLIPKELLNRTIQEIAKTDADLRDLVRAGLLTAQYNVNHWINMIILPQDQEVASFLGLPRHLTLGGDSAVSDKKPKFDHLEYNNKVHGKLDGIVDEYAEKAREAREGKTGCDPLPVVKLSKKQLEDLSTELYDKVRGFGRDMLGAPLVDIVL